ncbi:CoF synthetase [Flaviramulus sp. BrNp1-15]|uniref:CoF synthetase n=1 Tax=Flaviramulus sp. BrNp1-15 TaxID=2916754 RepID=UPI001EE95470|nr:CoF synthetase [Flaviramulus sp. BrNp1-15]ULC58281.1 CoF synthetase [Flaviramulus sp. BrNp1-15]
MRLLEKIRFTMFWFVDFLKGSKLKKHYKDITFILENYNLNSSKQRREAHLNSIIKHAIKTTEFYKKYTFNESLETLPVIDKNILREKHLEFLSNTMTKKKFYSTITTGSTGTPLEIFLDKNKRRRNTADVIYFSQLANFKIGFRLFYLRKWSVDLKKSFFLSWIQNVKALEVLNLNDENIDKIINNIKNDSSTKGFIGYASAYDVICKYLDRIKFKPINSNIKSIIAVSEGLNINTKKSLEYYFQAPVVSRYSNMENGIIAQQTPQSKNNFIINWASYYIEILDIDKDILAKPGEPGRIVVTDLFNYYMPIIRYDTGDIGTIDYSVQPPIFTKIEGRKTDVLYNTNGIVVPSMIIASIDRYDGIIQGQLIQESKYEYTLKLNVSELFNKELEIINEFKGYLGINAKIKVVYVNEIPLLDSGKRRSTVNNYIKQA